MGVHVGVWTTDSWTRWPHQEQISPSKNRRPDGSVAQCVGVLEDWFTVGISSDIGKGRWCAEDDL